MSDERVNAQMNINWIASYPKSGNTWMRCFLNAYFTDGPVNINDIEHICHVTDCSGVYPSLVTPFGADSSKLDPVIRLMYRNAALGNQIAIQKSERFKHLPQKYQFLKTHSARVTANDVHCMPMIFIDKAVNIVRDPRDVAVSYAKHFNVPKSQAVEDLNNPAKYLTPSNGGIHLLSTWSMHVDSWMKTPNTVTVRYEDMLKDPEDVFSVVLKYIDWEYDEERMCRAIENTKFSILQEQEKNNGFIERKGKENFFNSGTSERYKQELSAKLITRIEENHEEIMKKLNYL